MLLESIQVVNQWELQLSLNSFNSCHSDREKGASYFSKQITSLACIDSVSKPVSAFCSVYLCCVAYVMELCCDWIAMRNVEHCSPSANCILATIKSGKYTKG